MSVPIKKVTIELPADTYQKFRVECAKNQSTIKNGMLKLICSSLDGAIVEKQPEKGIVDDLDDEVTEKEFLDAKLTPILGMIEGLTSITQSQKADLDTLRVRLESPQNCPKLERFEEINKKLSWMSLGLAKLVSATMYLSVSSHVCDKDVEFLAILANEPKGKWTRKDQLEAFAREIQNKTL